MSDNKGKNVKLHNMLFSHLTFKALPHSLNMDILAQGYLLKTFDLTDVQFNVNINIGAKTIKTDLDYISIQYSSL